MNTYWLLVKGNSAEARRAAIRHGCTAQRCIVLPERNNTVVLARCDDLELHRWYGGDERERELMRSGKPLPVGALLYFWNGDGQAAPTTTPPETESYR